MPRRFINTPAEHQEYTSQNRPGMESLLNDVRYSYRTLLRSPGLTAVAVVSLALGIGANTAIFSFIDTVLLRSLPVAEPQRLVLFGSGTARGVVGGPPDGPMSLFSWRQYLIFRELKGVFTYVSAVKSLPTQSLPHHPRWALSRNPRAGAGGAVARQLLQCLGITPTSGRFFDEGADKGVNASPWIVLSDGYWERRFHRSTAAIGSRSAWKAFVHRNRRCAARVFRVASENRRMSGFRFQWRHAFTDGGPAQHSFDEFPLLIGRLKPGVTIRQAQAAVTCFISRCSGAKRLQPGRRSPILPICAGAAWISFREPGAGRFKERYNVPLRILMIMVALLLLIACGNVANLLLSLAAQRQKEFALRVAIGAGRSRVIRQLLTESLAAFRVRRFVGDSVCRGRGQTAGPLRSPLVRTNCRSSFDSMPVCWLLLFWCLSRRACFSLASRWRCVQAAPI